MTDNKPRVGKYCHVANPFISRQNRPTKRRGVEEMIEVSGTVLIHRTKICDDAEQTRLESVAVLRGIVVHGAFWNRSRQIIGIRPLYRHSCTLGWVTSMYHEHRYHLTQLEVPRTCRQYLLHGQRAGQKD